MSRRGSANDRALNPTARAEARKARSQHAGLLSIELEQFKLAFLKKVALTVVCDALWSKIVAGDCDLRLAVYYGPERQRLRQAKLVFVHDRYFQMFVSLCRYVEMKHMNVEPIDDIDFTRLPLDANLADVSRQQHAPELPTLTADDIRVFNQVC